MSKTVQILFRQKSFFLLLLVFSLGFTQDQSPVPGFGHSIQSNGSNNFSADGVCGQLTTNEITFEGWIRPQSEFNGSIMGFIKNDWDWVIDIGINAYGFYYWDSANAYRYFYENGEYYNGFDDLIGNWYHIALTIADNDSASIYVNGIKHLEFSTPLRPELDGRFHMGYGLSGRLDEIRVWNVARSESEITENMYGLLDGTEDGLAGYWRFDEGSGSETEDATANQNTGTLNGAFNEPWPLSVKPIFTISEDSLYFGNLFGHNWGDDRPASLIFEHPQSGNMGIVDPFEMLYEYIPTENMNHTNGPTDDGKIAFTYAMTTGAGATYADMAFIKILPLNDAPIIADTSIIPMFTPIIASQPYPNGVAVSDITTQLTIYDPDFAILSDDTMQNISVAAYGIAVSYVDDSLGTWEYCAESDCANEDWFVLDPEDFDVNAQESAILLRSDDRIRFIPSNDGVFQNGHSTIDLRIWDGTTYQPGILCDISESGGTTSISAEKITAKIEILSGPPVAGFGSAFSFNGYNANSIVVNNVCSQMITNELTIEGWVYIHSAAEGDDLFGFTSVTNGWNNLGVGVTNCGSEFAFGPFGFASKIDGSVYNMDDVSTDCDFELGNWNHIALTVADNDSGLLYINGNIVSQFTTTVRPTTDDLFEIGFYSTQSVMDEVRVWNVVRSETEIRESMYSLMSGVEEGLVGCWRFDKLQNVNGVGVTPDITPFQNYGELSAYPPTWLKSHDWASNPDLYFTGSDRGGFIKLDDSKWDAIGTYETIDLENEFTMSAWVFRDSPYDHLGVYLSSPGNYHFGYQVGSSNQDAYEVITFYDGQDWRSCEYTSTVPLNTWRHMTATYDGEILAIYENGVRVSQVQVGPHTISMNPDAGFFIGGIGAGSQDYQTGFTYGVDYQPWTVDGYMDDVTIWNRSLSPREINQLMSGIIENATDLIANWKFNESGGTAYSSAGQDYFANQLDLLSFYGDLPTREIIPLHKQFTVNEDSTLIDSVTGYDLNDDINLTYTLIQQPEHGTMTLDASSGEIIYTPAANYDGLDGFSYSISDPFGEADSTVAFVQVMPENDAPVILAENFSLNPIGNAEAMPSEGNHGETVTSILEYNQVSDVDVPWYVDINAVEGLAVTYIENTDGYWEYCTNCADDWENAQWIRVINELGNHNFETNALLLKPNDRIGFLPTNLNTDTTTTFKYRAWDMTEYLESGYADASITGEITSFSNEEASVTQPIVQAFVLDVENIEMSFLVPTDGSSSRRWELANELSLFGINYELGSEGNDSLIVQWTEVTDDSGKFEIWGAFDVTLDDDPDNKFDVNVVLGNPDDVAGEPGFLMTYKGSDGGASIYSKYIDMNITESFEYDGFTFNTIGADGEPGPIDFNYNFDESQFEITGGATMDFDDVLLSVDFVDPADESPGLIIKDGTLEKLVLVTNGNISIKGLDFEDDGLSFEYLHDDNAYAMWGGLKITIDGNELDLGLHDEDNPGILFSDGHLQQLDLDVNSDFNAGSFEFQTKDLDFRYEVGASVEKYTVRGEADLQLTDGMEVTLTLGHGTMPGIDVEVDESGTHFHLDEFEVEVQNLDLGTIDFKDAIFYYKNTGDEQDFYVDLKVSFPPGYEVDGGATFEIVDGVFVMDTVSLEWCTVGDQPGIEIPGTGFELVEIGGELDNLDDPSNISFTGTFAAAVAEQFSLDGEEVSVARIEGEVIIDKDHLYMDDQVLLGAYADGDVDCATTWNAALAYGELELYLGWARHFYYLDGYIDIPTDYGFRLSEKIWLRGSHLGMLAEIDVRVPESIHLIGGKTIGSIDFGLLMKYGGGSLQSGSFLAAWERISLGWFGHITAGFELGLRPFGFDFLGSGGVRHVSNEINNDFIRNQNTTISSSFDLEYTFAKSIVVPIDWYTAVDTVTLSVTGPTGSNFNFSLIDSAGVRLFTLTEEHAEVVYNDSTAVVYISATVDSADIIDLPLGTYTIDMIFDADNIDSALVLPMVNHRKPQIDISVDEVHQDSVILNVDYWVAPHLLDSAMVNFYVDLDTIHRMDGHLFADGMSFTNYDENTGWGSFPIIFTPGEHPTHNVAHSVFKPYYFYATMVDGENEMQSSNYSEAAYMTPPIYGQVLNADSGFVPIPNVRVFIDMDRDSNYAAHERYYDYGDDGLRDEDEPGYNAGTNPDPNGDNVVTPDGQYNPLGTENNLMYDEGEIYVDSDSSGVYSPILDIIDFTDEYGSFAFHGLSPGGYAVSLVIPHGSRVTNDSPSKEIEVVNYSNNPSGLFFIITANQDGEN